jgi:hypothetical protein
MYQGLSVIPFYGSKVAQSFKAVGVGAVTLVGVNKFACSGTLTGEGIATLVSSYGHIVTLGTAIGEGYVAIPLFNLHLADLGEAIGEAINNSNIGVGGSGNLKDVEERIEIEEAFKFAYDTAYKEMTYVGDDLTQIDIWKTASKIVKLFTKTLTYVGSNTVTVVITDEITTKILTKVLTYVNDELDTVTVTLS